MHYLQQVASHWKLFYPQVKYGPIFENSKGDSQQTDSKISAIFIMATDQHSRKDQEERLYAGGCTEYVHARSIKHFIKPGDLLLVQNPDDEKVVHSLGQLMVKPGTDPKELHYQSKPEFECNGYTKESGFHCKAVAFAPFTKYGDFPEKAANQLEIRGWDTEKYAKLQYALYRIGGAMHRILEWRYHYDKNNDGSEVAWKDQLEPFLKHEHEFLDAANESLRKINSVAKILQDLEIEGIEDLYIPTMGELRGKKFSEHKAINQYIYEHTRKFIPILAQKRNDHVLNIIKGEIKKRSNLPSRKIYVLIPKEHAFPSKMHWWQKAESGLNADLNHVAKKFQADIKDLGIPCIFSCMDEERRTSTQDLGAHDLGVYYNKLNDESRWNLPDEKNYTKITN